MTINEELLLLMMNFEKGHPERISHFMKVYEFAHLIGISENLSEKEQRMVDAAAILHDIAIGPCTEEYGYCDFELEEMEGPGYANFLLTDYGEIEGDEIDRICYMIGNHHYYLEEDEEQGIDYRVLIEADFLVRAIENQMSKEEILEGKAEVFRTETGIRMLEDMFEFCDEE